MKATIGLLGSILMIGGTVLAAPSVNAADFSFNFGVGRARPYRYYAPPPAYYYSPPPRVYIAPPPPRVYFQAPPRYYRGNNWKYRNYAPKRYYNGWRR